MPLRTDHRFPPSPTPVAAAALAGVLSLCAFPAAAQPAAATAAPAGAESRSFAVPAGPLGAALDRFARSAGVNLSYEPALVAGATTPGLSGTMPVAVALARLLAGTGLEALAQPGGGYSLRRAAVLAVPPVPGADATTLPVVRVTASQELPGELPRAYAGGQVARGSRTGMLGNSDVFETPFSTKAWTSELVRNQGARNVNDMVANDPSIRTSLSATSPLDQSSIRGFLTNSDAYLFDGLEGLFAYSNIPVRHYERLEVLKGPAGGLVGASGYGATVGGSFNLVPKRATDVPVRSVSVMALDKSLIGAHADIGQRFGVDQQFGARLNISAEDGRLYDGAQRRLIAPQVALDYRGETVRVVLDAGTTRRESSPLFGHWLLQAGAAVPAVPDPHVHAKPSWESMDLQQNYGLLSAEWDFAPGWTAHARHGRLRESPPVRQYVDQTTVDGAGQVRYASATSLLWTQANQVTDLGVRGEFQWGATRHKLAVGTVMQRQQLQDLRSVTRPLAVPVVSNIYQPLAVPDPFASGVPSVAGVTSPAMHLDSVAVADTVALLDERLLLTAAARHQRIEKAPYRQSRITPTLAALYKLGGGVSVYGNYAESLAQGAIAPAGSANAGEQLEPYLSRQHELGLKWDAGRYGITVAYFDIRRATAFVDGGNVFRAAGLQRNQGVELETFGEVARGVRLLGGVAWTDGRMSRTAGGATDGKKAIGVPELTANLGVEYDLASVPGLTLTGRYLHTGSAYVDPANTQKVAAWNRVDVGLRYRTAVGDGTTLTLQAGITNLADKAYWTIAGRNFIAVAPPRTWQVSASFDF